MNGEEKEEVIGYLRTSGKHLVNGNGEDILLRGVGLGGWLLPEGYMWQFPEQGDRPRKMEKYIESCIGKEAAEEFWHQYRSRFITEADIIQIKKEGFNSIRLPFNARLLVKDGNYNLSELFFIDQVIAWCEKHKLYVILDMHGVLGGQTGTNIDDSMNDHPDFFTDRRYQTATIQLWQFLAERYKDRWIIGGYDLMNEPLPKWFSSYNDLVMPIYREIIAAIRKVDQQHMIVLEGVHWSTDWSIFNEILDGNILYQFHKYWNNPDQKSIKNYLDFREMHQVPIFMGEGGENNKEWYIGAFSMFEDLNISWNFWTYKKMDNDNSLCSIEVPKDWEIFVNHLKKGVPTDKQIAQSILTEFLDNIRFERCHYYKDVADALFCRAPITIPAIFYSNLGRGIGYHMNEDYVGPVDFRKSDHTQIELKEGNKSKINFANGKGQKWNDTDIAAVRLLEGEWLKYAVFVSEKGSYTFELAARNLADINHIELTVEQQDGEVINLAGDDMVVYAFKKPLHLEMGHHKFKIKIIVGCSLIEWIRIQEQ